MIYSKKKIASGLPWKRRLLFPLIYFNLVVAVNKLKVVVGIVDKISEQLYMQQCFHWAVNCAWSAGDISQWDSPSIFNAVSCHGHGQVVDGHVGRIPHPDDDRWDDVQFRTDSLRNCCRFRRAGGQNGLGLLHSLGDGHAFRYSIHAVIFMSVEWHVASFSVTFCFFEMSLLWEELDKVASSLTFDVWLI